MERRSLLAGLGAVAGAAGLAGCTVRLPKPGSPELDHQVDHEAFVGDGFQPTVVVTGQASNVGSVYVKRARLTAVLVDADGEAIDERSTDLERLERGESQSFHFVFPVSATDVGTLDRVDVEVAYPGQDS